jgi:hypothetical protein
MEPESIARRSVAGTKVDTKPDLPSADVKADTLSPKELAEMQKALAQRQMQMGPHALDTVLEQTVARTNDQRQEQQLYASTWGGMAGVVAALVKVSDYERDQSRRKALEAIQNEMFELLAKEKRKDALRGSPFFKQLVSILGPDTAESITQKLEAAGSSGASGLQANQAALAQAAKEIAALLEKNQAVLGLGVTGEALAKTLEGEMTGAIALIPKSSPQLSVVKQSDTLATQTHEQMKSLERGDERLARLQTIRSELGPEKFSAMIDAYDKKYGVPLVTHIANLSTTNPSLQGQMRHETLALLSPEQRQRVTDFGRAEYAQTMALLDAQRESARDALSGVTQEMRATEKVLATELGKPELAILPEGEIRAKLLEALSSRLPELKGMSWEATYLRLKEVAGQTDDKSLATALRSINGGTDPQDPAALREYIARATLQMQKLATLDQQLEGYKNLLSTAETSDEGRLRKYYSLAYGADVTTRDASYDATKKAAGAYITTLHQRIGDPSLSVEDRANLIRERDAIEFSVAKKLAADALHGGEKPNAQLALGILKNFAVSYGDTPARRGDAYRTACEHLITSIESAHALHQEWVELDAQQIRPLDPSEPKVPGTISCLTGKPGGPQELDLRQRFSELNRAAPKVGLSDDALQHFIAAAAKGGMRSDQVSNATGPELVKAQREAALSTNFFAHILDGEVPYRSVPAPSLSMEGSYATAKALTTYDRIATVTKALDEVSAKLPRELRDLEAQASSSFLATSTQRAVTTGLRREICAKLGVASGSEGVSKVLGEIDPLKDLTVDAAVLEHLRKAVPADNEIGRAFAVGPATSGDARQDYESVKARLDPVNSLRLELLVAREADAQARGGASVDSATVKTIFQETPENVAAAVAQAREHARLSRCESLLGALTDEEHQEFLRFFEATTKRSLGQTLTANLPIDQGRQEILLRLAGSRSVQSRDLQRFYGEPVPNDLMARVETLSRAMQADAQRTPLKTAEVEQAARASAAQYGTLREAAMVAMRQGDVALLREITEKLKATEARLSGTIAKSIAQTDASYLARIGGREYLQALQENALQEEYSQHTAGRVTVAALAKDIAELLRSETPKTDAAFNRVRQANLSEEQTLLLRAIYSKESKRRSPELEQRTLTGALQRDLQPTNSPGTEERERVALLVKGGTEALREVDKRTLAIAEREQNEKRQLETLSNLRATGQYGAMKEQLSTMKLTPAAQEYRKAVESGDTAKADAADLSIKAKNGDVKPSEVAAFLKDKNPEDVARVTKEYPTLAQDLAKANSFFNEEYAKQLMSNIAADRQRALEQAMLKSLTSPEEFEAWLKVEPVLMQRWVMLNNLEELLEKEPTKPTFVNNGEPKIVQYVRAQKTDLREIDAELIKAIIHETRGWKQSSSSATLDQLRALREQAIAQLTEFDLFGKPRLNTLKAAEENLANKHEASAWIETEQNRRWHWSSGHLLDSSRDLTRARISEQQSLIASMAKGAADIESSRELIRYGFGLMAKDLVQEVDRGLSPETTACVSTLLQTRDVKVAWRITDEAREREWNATVKQAEQRLERRDTVTTVGMAVLKIGTTVAAGIFLSPMAGLAVATAWNAGDKIYRGVVLKESPKSLAKAFVVEFAWDAVFIGVSYMATASRLSKLRFFNSSRTVEVTVKANKEALKQVGKGGVITAQEAAAKETAHAIKDGVTKVRNELAKSGENGFTVGYEAARRGATVPGPSLPSSPEPNRKPQALKALDEDPAKRQKLVEGTFQGSPSEKKPGDDVPDLVLTKKPVREESVTPPPAPAVAQSQSSGIEVTIPVNPALLAKIKEKVDSYPTSEANRSLTELQSALSQPSVRDDEGVRMLQELRDDLKDLVIFPELVNALDKLLSGPSPFIKFLSAGSTGEENRPQQPPSQPPPHTGGPPPQQPPPPPHSPPSGGGGSGGMSGPALVIASAPRGDSNGNADERRIGNAYERALATGVEQPVSMTNLSASTLATGVSRAEQQAAVMHDALQRATAHQAEEARLVPTPHHQSHGVRLSVDIAQSAEVATSAMRHAQAAEEPLQIPRRVEEERSQRVSSGEELATPSAIKRKKPLDESMSEQMLSLVDEQRVERRASRSIAEKGAVDRAVEIKADARREEASDKESSHAKQRSAVADATAETERQIAQRQVNAKERGVESERVVTKAGVVAKERVAPAESISARRSTEHPESASTAEGNVPRGKVSEREVATSTLAKETASRPTPSTPITAHGQLQHQAGSPLGDIERTPTNGGKSLSTQHQGSQGNVRFTTPYGASVIEARQDVRSSESQREMSPSAPSVTGVQATEMIGPFNPLAELPVAALSQDGLSPSEQSSRSRSPRSKKRDDARMRNLLLQQLMAQHSNKVQREKILKALISLGISEVEYRNLLVTLGEMEMARQAEQAAATVKAVEPIALAVEVPTMKNSLAEPSAQRSDRPAADPATTSRAALYKRLKQDASAFRK